MLPETHYAWAAGIVDGEGHFGIQDGYPHLSVAQCHLEMLHRMQAIFGGGISGPIKRRVGWSVIWNWRLDGLYNVYPAFDLMRPWLGTPKVEQATAVFLQSKLVARPGYCRRDLHLMEESVASTEKRCRLCRNDQANQRYHARRVAP